MTVLVKAGDLAEVGGRSTSSGAAFKVARQCRGVVSEVGNSSSTCIVGVGDVVKLNHHGSLFKVAVGDVARQVVTRDKVTHCVLREWVSAHSGRMASRKVDATKTITACIHSADHFW